jgi:hypothetical protein
MIAQQSSAFATVPKGHPKNSPAFQRRVGQAFISSPEGTAECVHLCLSSHQNPALRNESMSRPVKLGQSESRRVKHFLKKIFFLQRRQVLSLSQATQAVFGKKDCLNSVTTSVPRGASLALKKCQTNPNSPPKNGLHF